MEFLEGELNTFSHGHDSAYLNYSSDNCEERERRHSLDSSRASSPPWSCNASTCTASTEDTSLDWLFQPQLPGGDGCNSGSPLPESRQDSSKAALEVEIPKTCKKCKEKHKYVQLAEIPVDKDGLRDYFWERQMKSRRYLSNYVPLAHCGLCSRIFCVCNTCKQPMFPTRNHLSDLESHLRGCQRKAQNAQTRAALPFFSLPEGGEGAASAGAAATNTKTDLVQACTVLYNSKDIEESRRDLEQLKSLLLARFEVKQCPGQLSMVTLLCLDILHKIRGSLQEKKLRDQLSSHLRRLLLDLANSSDGYAAETDVVQALQTACRVSREEVYAVLGIESSAERHDDDVVCDILVQVVALYLQRTNVFDFDSWTSKMQAAHRECEAAAGPHARREFLLAKVNSLLESRFQYAVCGFSAEPSHSYALITWAEPLFVTLLTLLARYDAPTRRVLTALGFKLVLSSPTLPPHPASPTSSDPDMDDLAVQSAKKEVAEFVSGAYHGREDREGAGTSEGSCYAASTSTVVWLDDAGTHRSVVPPGRVERALSGLAAVPMSKLVLDDVAAIASAGKKRDTSALFPPPAHASGLTVSPLRTEGSAAPLPPKPPHQLASVGGSVGERSGVGGRQGEGGGPRLLRAVEGCVGCEGTCGPAELTAETIKQHFHLPLEVAAARMGVCVHAAITACANIGIRTWPHSLILASASTAEKHNAANNTRFASENGGSAADFGGGGGSPLARKPTDAGGSSDLPPREPPFSLSRKPPLLFDLPSIEQGVSRGRAVHWLKLSQAAAALGTSSRALRTAFRLGVRRSAVRRMRPAANARTPKLTRAPRSATVQVAVY